LLTGQASVDDKEQLAMPVGSAIGQPLKAKNAGEIWENMGKPP